MTKIFEKPYIVTDSSIIYFGKYKGKTHKELLQDRAYCDWMINSTEPLFGQSTKIYLKGKNIF
jgi:hypothetical protein